MINAEYVLFAGVLGLIVVDLLRRRLSVSKEIIHWITLFILIAAFVSEILFGNLNVDFFASVQYTQFINGFILFLSLIIYGFLFADSKEFGTLVDALFLFAVLGATLVVLSSNFISLIISIEMISIASYGLVFFQKSNSRMEGAMKYVTISFLSVVIMIFGVSLIFGGAGTLSFSTISNVNYLPFISGLALVIAGLAFKSTIVPFHMWAPDVYEASNGAVTAFLSSVSKTAGLVAMIRVFFFALPVSSQFVEMMFVILAIATIFFASFLATAQDRIKRLLAYSSIAQAGFAFIGIALLNYIAISAAVFYIFTFAIADALVFLAYKIFEDNKIIYKKDATRMFSTSKIATAGLFLGILSLAGMPPTIGFFGKLAIFVSLLSKGYVYLVLALFVITLFSTFYYLGLLREMEFSSKEAAVKRNFRLKIKEVLIVILVIALFAGAVFSVF